MTTENHAATIELTDVTTQNDKQLETTELGGHSLPLAEDIKATLKSEDIGPSREKQRRIFVVAGFAVLLIACLFMAIYFPLTKNNSNSSPSESSSQTQGSGSNTNTTVPSPSSSPAFFNRTEEVFTFLAQRVGAAELYDPSSPQYAAAKWMVQDTNPINSSSWQRYALATLYFSTGGPFWAADVGFLSDQSECDWFQYFPVELVGDTLYYIQVGAYCNNTEGIVDTLALLSFNMTGSVPSEMALLTALTWLQLNDNDFTNSLPESLSALTNLEFITLSRNRFNGSVPTWIGALTSLTQLVLYNNDLSGSLPTALGNLTNLQFMALDNNKIGGPLDVVENLIGLTELYLESNMFTGIVTEKFMVNLMSLQKIDVSDNLLEGAVPESLLAKESLQVLDLSQNYIRGNIPSNLANNTALEFLGLYSNFLKGSIPSSISKLVSLTHLDYARNNMTGPLPTSLGLMTTLQYLWLSHNAFTISAIPSWIGGLTKLEELSLKATQRNGTIPKSLSNLTSLVLLDLDRNNLEGTLPASLVNITSLTFLLVNRNPKLTGTLPQVYAKMSNLQMIVLDQTNLTGSVDQICKSPLQVAIADCSVQCSCCTYCCSKNNESICNAADLLATEKASWHNDFTRGGFYSFSASINFSSVGGG